MAEWFKALVLKTSVGETLPRVRIPALPPIAKVLDVVKLQALYVVRKLGDLPVGRNWHLFAGKHTGCVAGLPSRAEWGSNPPIRSRILTVCLGTRHSLYDQ